MLHIVWSLLRRRFTRRLTRLQTMDLYVRCIATPLGWTREGQGTNNQILPSSRADALLSDEVKQKWEKEQETMKSQLTLCDTDDLAAMATLPKQLPDDCKQYYIGGVDISFVKGDDVNACAALVVITYPQLELVYEDYEMVELTEPYIPGFLGFREVPFIQLLVDKLRCDQPQLVPHVVMVDGNGILHPKGFGSACHLGVSLKLPCVGVAKKLFQVDGLEKDESHHKKIEALTKGGDTFPLVGDSGKTWGMALRSCDSTKNPVYVSPGHMVTMETAVTLVHRCCNHRIPEPVRLADINSREYIRQNFKPADPDKS